jgi:hypothetical protein
MTHGVSPDGKSSSHSLALGAEERGCCKWERGERRLDVVELQLWCKALGVRMPDFVKQLDRRLDRSR